MLYFACGFSDGKAVEVCHDRETARYVFGPPDGTPELELSAPVTEIHLTPWPGIGLDVWEELVFLNAGHSYTIAPRLNRNFPNDDSAVTVEPAGALIVARGDETLVEMTCDPASVQFPWDTTLFDAKSAKGQCYDPIARHWNTC